MGRHEQCSETGCIATSSRATRHVGQHCVAIMILLCLVLLYHAPLLLKNLGYYSNDIMHQHFPSFVFAAQSLGTGEFPLWNPYHFSGMPFLADSVSQLLYPPLWGLFLLERKSAFMAYILFHYALAGISMYFLLRHLKVTWWPAMTSAAAFAFGGFMLLQTSDLLPFCAFAWIPSVMLTASRAARHRTFSAGIVFGLFSALQLLSGSAQLWLGTLYLAVIYGLVLWTSKRITNWKQEAYRLAKVALGTVLGLSVTAAQVLPSWELTQQSVRSGGMSYDSASMYSLAPERLSSIIAPYLWGPAGWPEVMSVGDGRLGYLGVTTIVLAIVAIILAFQRTETRFFACASVLFLCLALGRYSFLHLLAYEILPGYHLFRAPVRHLAFYAFTISILAGFGLESLLEKSNHLKVPIRRIMILIFVLLLVVVFGSVVSSQSHSKWPVSIGAPFLFLGLSAFLLIGRHLKLLPLSSFGLLSMLLIVIDLFFFALQARLPVAPTDIFNFEPLEPIVDFLREDTEYVRVYWPNTLRVEEQGLTYEARAPLAMMYRISNVEGYSQFELRSYERLFQELPLARALELLNVKYVLTNSSQEFVSSSRQPAFSANGIFVHKLPTYLPRAFVVGQWSSMSTSDMFKTLRDPSFDPQREVLFEELPFPDTAFSSEPLRGNVQVLSYEPQEIRLLASLSREGILVLNEPFYPGWKCEVDGQSVDLLFADAVFRAVPLSSGSHHVRVFFHPLSVLAGIGISVLGLVGAGAGILHFG